MTDLFRTALSAMACRPDELKIFLKTLPFEGHAALGQTPSHGRVNSLSGGRDFRIAKGAAQPLKEIAVAASVIIVTAALGFWAIMAAAG
ncbi:MAG: hypothetical protein WAN43_12915 [Rhodomicrobium sp.]